MSNTVNSTSFQIDERIYRDANMKKIFAFWESKDKIPAYLELCKKTWIKNIPDAEIHIINYDNIEYYLGDTYSLDQIKKISLAMQSDIISAAILEKFGGLFLDLDCIVTKDIFKILESLSSESKLIAFGYPPNRGIHLAILYSSRPNNPILAQWRKTAQDRLKDLPEKYNWDFFGNSILNPLLKNEEYQNDFLVIDRTESGNILESKLMLDSTGQNAKEFYKNFYFNKYLKVDVDVLELVTYGVISLHNSWTPTDYKAIKDIDIILKDERNISQLLKSVLNADSSVDNPYVNIAFLKNYFDREINFFKLNFKSRFFKDILVLDCQMSGLVFAFDIYVAGNVIGLDIVARDAFSLNRLKDSEIGSTLRFNLNKANVMKSESKESIFEEILRTYNYLSELGSL